MYEYRVLEVLKVLDGDTVDVRADLGFGLTANLRIRVLGVDTPELHAPDPAPGAAARGFTTAWLAQHTGGLTVRTVKAGPASMGVGDGHFGRWLGDITTAGGESLTGALIAAGHGKAT